MNKREFLEALSRRLMSLDPAEQAKSLSFYDEMIDDRIEDGMTEAEAVAALGSMDDIVAAIVSQLPLATVVKRRVKASREGAKNPTLWMVLAICGSPIWFPLAISFAAVVLVIYAVVWVLIVALYAVLISLAAAAVLGIMVGLIRCFSQGLAAGVLTIGAGVTCAGLTIMGVWPMRYLTKRLLDFTVWFGGKIKEKLLSRKGVA